MVMAEANTARDNRFFQPVQPNGEVVRMQEKRQEFGS